MVRFSMNKDESAGSSAMQIKSVSVMSGGRELFRIPRGWLIVAAALVAWAILFGGLWLLASALRYLFG